MKKSMWKNGIILGILILFIGASVVPSNVSIVFDYYSQPDIVYVDDDYNSSTPGWGYDHFDSIQDGIDAVNVNGTVYVYNGTYYENVIINKDGINLIGEDKNTTIIDGSDSGDVVHIIADWVNISGFTIRKGFDGIYIKSNYNIISENIISNNGDGIRVYKSNSNTIKWNTILDHNYGISLYESNSTFIIGNSISDHSHGIELYRSSGNTITDNSISNSWYDGIYLSGSYGYPCNNHIITNNTILNNGYGIYSYTYYYSKYNNNIITGNTISYNDDGIYLQGSSNTITDNTISNNNDYGVILGGDSNTITDNNIISNNDKGISVFGSNNTVTYNNISNNGGGISLSGFNNSILNNSFFNDGLFVSDSYSNNVENNMVNGKPLVYLEDESDDIIADAGQVILVNCDNIITENLTLSNVYVGIELWGTINSNIRNNDCSNNDYYGVYLYESSNINISGNTISSNNRYGIYLYESSTSNIITDNTISNNDYYGIYLYESSTNNTITNNTISNNGEVGIDLLYSGSNTISGNNISSNNRCGISFFGSLNNIITANTIMNNGCGIWLMSYNNTIAANTITSNNGNGIHLRGSSENNITSNTIAANNGDGISLDVYVFFPSSQMSPSRLNTIKGNTISKNWVGIYIYQRSSSNVILKNNFLDNDRDAFFSNSFLNRWKQNYWNRPRIIPKIIFGKIIIQDRELPWINIDWRPAQEPYDIEV